MGQAVEFRVNTYTVGDQGRPAVAARADGDFVVAWNSFNQESPGNATGNYGIFARRFSSAGVAQAVEFLVNTYTTAYQRYPRVAADNDGDFVVTWESQHQDGNYEGVFARRILGNGAFGPEFQANSYTMDGQTEPVVDFDSDGDFVIAWYTEENQDGNSYGIFAQRFTLPPLATLDVDGNGLIAPLTDGLLVLRHIFGFSGLPASSTARSEPTARAAPPERSLPTSTGSARRSTSTATRCSSPWPTASSSCGTCSDSRGPRSPTALSATCARAATPRRSFPISRPWTDGRPVAASARRLRITW